jgi:hypothetical protein
MRGVHVLLHSEYGCFLAQRNYFSTGTSIRLKQDKTQQKVYEMMEKTRASVAILGTSICGSTVMVFILILRISSLPA